MSYVITQKAAYKRVEKAIATGVLERPDVCEMCSAPTKPYAHHDDYQKPLEVRWLCSTCHKLTHPYSTPEHHKVVSPFTYTITRRERKPGLDFIPRLVPKPLPHRDVERIFKKIGPLA